jgi:hypothetical protein
MGVRAKALLRRSGRCQCCLRPSDSSGVASARTEQVQARRASRLPVRLLCASPAGKSLAPDLDLAHGTRRPGAAADLVVAQRSPQLGGVRGSLVRRHLGDRLRRLGELRKLPLDGLQARPAPRTPRHQIATPASITRLPICSAIMPPPTSLSRPASSIRAFTRSRTSPSSCAPGRSSRAHACRLRASARCCAASRCLRSPGSGTDPFRSRARTRASGTARRGDQAGNELLAARRAVRVQAVSESPDRATPRAHRPRLEVLHRPPRHPGTFGEPPRTEPSSQPQAAQLRAEPWNGCNVATNRRGSITRETGTSGHTAWRKRRVRSSHWAPCRDGSMGSVDGVVAGKKGGNSD